jgi:hypothetical protein
MISMSVTVEAQLPIQLPRIAGSAAERDAGRQNTPRARARRTTSGGRLIRWKDLIDGVNESAP